jgi:hypothetical protein
VIEPSSDLLEPSRREGPFDRLLGLLVRVQTPLGLLLVVGGFVAVFLGWLEASGTADVRIQMQDLISGGVGGLGLLVIGGVLLQSALADRAARRTESALVRLADALEHGASTTTSATASATAPAADSKAALTVLATHASFHLPGCDLIEDRETDQVSTTSMAQARLSGLKPCRVCLPTAVGQ